MIPVPTKNPKNAPKADFKDTDQLLLVWISSPIKAPTNGPQIIPAGPIKNPTIKPIVEPSVALLLPPAFFVMVTGKILSKTDTTTATTPVIISIVREISVYPEKYAKTKPTKANGAPGKTGTNVPKKPIQRKIPQSTQNKISKVSSKIE